MEIKYRSVDTEAGRHQVERLAYDVFHKEMGFAGDMVDHELQLLVDDFEAECDYIGAFDGDELVGCVALLSHRNNSLGVDFDHAFSVATFLRIVEPDRLKVAVRFMVRESHRGSQVPLRLVTEVAGAAGRAQAAVVFGDCQPHLIDLYVALGFDQIGPAFDQPGFGLMVPLALLNSSSYLKSKGSMLAGYTTQAPEEEQLIAAVSKLGQSAVGDVASQWAESWAERLQRHECSLFDDLCDDEIQKLCTRARVIEAPVGAAIVTEGQGARTAYVVLDGTVRVSTNGIELARLGVGQVVGETAMLLGSGRTADVVAVTDVRVLALNDKVLAGLVERTPDLAAKVYRNLSRTLAAKLIERA